MNQQDGRYVDFAGESVDKNAESSNFRAGISSAQRNPKRKAMWRAKDLWNAANLDADSLLKMIKGALPPVIVIAMYQSDAVSNITVTVGYLSALAAVTSQCLLPRAKFMKIMLFIVLSTCVAASICCLAIFCAVKARHPQASIVPLQVYDSSASAVSGIWLFFVIWISNTLRALRPVELQDPMVVFSIFSAITLTRAPQFTTVSQGLAFIKRLLLAFLFGFSIATGISLLILPITNRRNVFKGTLKYVEEIGRILSNQKTFIGSIQRHSTSEDKAEKETGQNSTLSGHRDDGRISSDKGATQSTEYAATKLNSDMAALIALHDKLAGDLRYAKIEIAWGYLAPTDLGHIFSLLRSLLLPLAGLTLLPDIFNRLEEWHQVQCGWTEFLVPLNEELAVVMHLVMQGLQHSLITLGISSSKECKKKFTDLAHSTYKVGDIESSPSALVPGNGDFSSHFEQTVQDFYCRRQKNIAWPTASSDGEAIHLSGEDFADIADSTKSFSMETTFIQLFMEHLMDTLLQSVLDFVKFAENKVADRTMARRRLIIPQVEYLSTVFSFGPNDECVCEDQKEGEASERPSDPEHLPPVNAWERGSGLFRTVSRFLSSDQSAFGFRAAAASFTAAVLAYLRQTQEFFLKERVIWVLIVIIIGMTPTSGASLFSFAGRIIASVVSLAVSVIVWYIVVGHTAGVIVFLFLGNVFLYYFYVKHPRIFGPSVISIVTFNVIVGYELQVKKLGIPRAESAGQPYYPVYLFGTYKLVCVIAGCAIAFFWTVFPYPFTTSSQVRKLLGRSLFVLANFYSCMHTTIQVWINEQQKEAEVPLGRLKATKDKLFAEEMSLLTAIRTQIGFTTYEPPIGGKFPRAIYGRIVSGMQTILMSMALMAQTTRGLHGLSLQQEENWLRRLAQAMRETHYDPHVTTALLCQLSAAVSNGLALTPHLSPPSSFALARELRNLNEELFDVKNKIEPAYSAFAVLEVSSALLSYKLTKLLGDVRLLVGEVSFEATLGRSARQEVEKQRAGEKVE